MDSYNILKMSSSSWRNSGFKNCDSSDINIKFYSYVPIYIFFCNMFFGGGQFQQKAFFKTAFTPDYNSGKCFL